MPYKSVIKIASSTVDWSVILSGISSLTIPIFGLYYTQTGAILAGIGGLLIGCGKFSSYIASARKMNIEAKMLECNCDKESISRLESLVCLNSNSCKTHRGIHHYNPEED